MLRARLAALSMLGSVVAAPAGAYVLWGLGVGLLVAAGCLFVAALLLGWGIEPSRGGN